MKLTPAQQAVIDQIKASPLWTVDQVEVMSAGTAFIVAKRNTGHALTEIMVCGGIGKRGKLRLKEHGILNSHEITKSYQLRSLLS